MRIKKFGTEGFTLLEMIVTLAIVVIVSIILTQVFFTTLRTNTKTELLKEMKQNGELSLELMVRAIQSAQNVTCTSAQELSVTATDGAITTIGCSFDGSVTRLASDSASGTAYITSQNATLGGSDCSTSSLNFTCSGSAGQPVTVDISFQLAQTGTAVGAFEQASVPFQTSASTRNIPR